MSDETKALGPSTFDRVKAAIDGVHPLHHVGPYRILDLLGAGGMGDVYKAERRSPFQQIVAIKIIKLGFDSREVLARFESERQALARTDHPNIAKVLDAGVTDTGRPYFVMEYVPGVPITKFADDNKLSIKDRLLLFTQACDAITHAHTKAIIHRDIKAGNVLAYLHDGKPTVKVIDFGIAKALTGDRLTDATFNTAAGGIIGTYDTMSPEQADGSPDIDTRTDVYSLGVLLYELLTGATPFDYATLARAANEEIKRIIREVEPPRPSTRLSSLGAEAKRIAGLRDMKLDQLERDLRRELEWIPLKAMRKERSRRYASPLQLKLDIENYLQGRPLIAGPESRLYKLRKFTRRHRSPLVAAAVAILLLAGAVAFYIQSIRAEQRRTQAALQDARYQGEIARAVTKFLTDRVLAGATPEQMPNKALRDEIVKRMLDPAAAAVANDFKGQPLTEAAVRSSLAVSYHSIGRVDLAIPHAQAALSLRRRLLGDNHPHTMESITRMGLLLKWQGKLDAAEALLREALERRRRVLGDDHPETMASINNHALMRGLLGKLDESELLQREAMQRRRRVLGDNHPDTLKSINNMGDVLRRIGKLEEAESLCREALERRRQVLGNEHPETIRSIINMGTLLRAQHKLDEAESLYREALQRGRRVLGDDHPVTLWSISMMGRLLHDQGKLAQAELLHREALERSRRVLGDDHPDTLISVINLAFLLHQLGKLDDAAPLYHEAVTNARANPSFEPKPFTRQFASNYANCLDSLRRHDEAAVVRKEFGLPAPASVRTSVPTTRDSFAPSSGAGD